MCPDARRNAMDNSVTHRYRGILLPDTRSYHILPVPNILILR